MAQKAVRFLWQKIKITKSGGTGGEIIIAEK
jgi:hypothetical protein